MQLFISKKVYYNTNGETIALQNIDMKLTNNGVVMIVGPSGCGKTTLLNIISKVDPNFEGNIIGDESIEFIKQEPDFIWNLSVYMNLQLVSSKHDLIDSLLKQFELYEIKENNVKLLSGGQLKRLQIIRSLLVQPDILLCDEPTASLDEENKNYVMNILKEISITKIVVIVTHETNLIEVYADALIKMDNGVIVDSKRINNMSKHDIIGNSRQSNKTLRDFLALSKNIRNMVVILLGLLLTFSLYISLEVNNNVQNELVKQANWFTSSNLLESIPFDEYVDLKNYTCTEFHFWTQDEVDKIIEKHPEIIGYSRYDDGFFDTTSIDSIFKKYTENMKFEIIGIKDEERDNKGGIGGEIIYEGIPSQDPQLYDYIYNYNRSPYLDELFQQYYYVVQNPMVADEPMVYSNYDGFYKSGYAFSKPTYIYEIVSEDGFDVGIGYFPENVDEILITKQLAEYLATLWELDSINDVVGKMVDIYYLSGNNTYTKNPDTYKLMISGITLQGNLSERQIFMTESNYDRMYESIWGYDHKNVSFPRINLIIDPNCNKEKLMEQLNQEIAYTKSYIRDKTYYGLGDIFEDVKEMKDVSFDLLENVTRFIIGLIILILIIFSISVSKEQINENSVLKRYGFNIIGKSFIVWGLMCIVLSGISLLSQPVLISIFNKVLMEYVYSGTFSTDIINNNYKVLVICLIISFMVIGICEVIRNVKFRKH